MSGRQIHPKLSLHFDDVGLLVRPYLFLVGYQTGKEVQSNLGLDILVGLELLQQSTLLVDDVLDEAPLRNGVPALWTELGEKAALCVGYQVFVRGQRMFCSELAGLPNGASAVRELLAGLEALYEGQCLDVIAAPFQVVGFDEYRRIIRLTTGRFLESSLLSGALLGGTDVEIQRILREWAVLWGEAYQMRDDILDYFEQEKSTGKLAMTDLKAGKLRLPALICLEDLPKEEARRFLRNARAVCNDDSTAQDEVWNTLRKTDSIRKAAEHVAQLCSEACADLGPPLDPSVVYVLSALSAMVGFFRLPESAVWKPD
ncbi:polyprenyl synthetase family protein [bacterium]|nr:polyprenyl synthetase family protein [bacterium]